MVDHSSRLSTGGAVVKGTKPVGKLDAVAQRLAAGDSDAAASLLAWTDSKYSRKLMIRRAFWCSFSSWLLVSAAALVGTWVSWMFLAHARDLVDVYDFEQPTFAIIMPRVFTVISVILIAGGVIAWMTGNFPGFNKTKNAIDWAGNSEAVSRLLSAGCTYPDAFKAAANVAQTKESRDWLTQAASRVERGGPEIGTTDSFGGDAGIVELLLESNFAHPSEKWQIASEHFDNVSRHRSALLIGTVPVLSTLVAGIFVWVSISATLGWMWSGAVEMIGGLR